MKQCAVVLNGNDVVKVSNLKRKYDKIMSNPNMKILEECDKEMLDEKYNYWNRTLNRNIEEEKNEEAKLHHLGIQKQVALQQVSIQIQRNVNHI